MQRNYLQVFVLSFVLLCCTWQTQGQSKRQVQEYTATYNLKTLQRLELSQKQKTLAEKEEAFRIAKQKNWKTKYTNKDGSLLELQRVVDGHPIYYTTFNSNAAKSTRANHLNTGGSLGLNLMGKGLTAYVWDGGLARRTHQEYDGAGGSNRFSVGDNSGTTNYHAAHVTGTIMAAGIRPQAKGMLLMQELKDMTGTMINQKRHLLLLRECYCLIIHMVMLSEISKVRFNYRSITLVDILMSLVFGMKSCSMLQTI